MTQENENTNLITLPEGEPLVKHTQEDFNEVAKTADYLPRLTLIGSQSDLFMTQKIQKLGVYALQWDANRFIELKNDINIIAYTWRPKALDMTGGTPLSFFDRNSQAFQDTAVKANLPNSKCTVGPEFLIYIPEHDQIAQFHMGSKTARKESPNMLLLMNPSGANPPVWEPCLANLKSTLIVGKDYKWYGPVVSKCNTPVSRQPDMEDLQIEIHKFNNPPEPQVEKAPTQPAGGPARER